MALDPDRPQPHDHPQPQPLTGLALAPTLNGTPHQPEHHNQNHPRPRSHRTTTYCDMYYFEDAIADEVVNFCIKEYFGEKQAGT